MSPRKNHRTPHLSFPVNTTASFRISLESSEVIACIFNPSAVEAEVGEVKASLVYIQGSNSLTAETTQRPEATQRPCATQGPITLKLSLRCQESHSCQSRRLSSCPWCGVEITLVVLGALGVSSRFGKPFPSLGR